MFDKFWDWIFEKWPQLTVILAVVCFTIWVTYKVMKAYSHWALRVHKAEKECERIDDHIVPKLNSIEDSVNSLNQSVSNLIVYLSGKDKGMKTDLFMSKSPVQLTPLGIEILENSGGKKYIDDNASHLISALDKENIKTALDAENASQSLLIKEINNDPFIPLKKYLFNNPIYRKSPDVQLGLDAFLLCNIMGIYLRDKYLELHPQLKDDK